MYWFRASLLMMVLLVAGCCGSGCIEPPGGNFQRFSELAHFPDFYPGLGRLYVQPSTMPIGPYYGYDRHGRLVNTIYMVPLEFFNEHRVEQLIEGTRRRVDHVALAYTSGHPGVEEPHYHIVLWHISAEEAEQVQ